MQTAKYNDSLTAEFKNKLKGKRLLDIRAKSDYDLELEFEGGVVFQLNVIARFYDDPYLKYELIEVEYADTK